MVQVFFFSDTLISEELLKIIKERIPSTSDIRLELRERQFRGALDPNLVVATGAFLVEFAALIIAVASYLRETSEKKQTKVVIRGRKLNTKSGGEIQEFEIDIDAAPDQVGDILKHIGNDIRVRMP